MLTGREITPQLQAPMSAMSDVVTVMQKKKKTDWKLNERFSVGRDRPVKGATSTSRHGLLFPEKFLQDRMYASTEI